MKDARTSDGFLLVDKPAGMSSHDVVLIARRAVGEPRIGHLGTLDPFATGLLVLLLGRATRLAPYAAGEPKTYEATIAFGSETDTDDLTGTEIRSAHYPRSDAVERAVRELTGTLRHEPPAYSARKVGGVRAYALARRARPVTLAPAEVTVHEWTILDVHRSAGAVVGCEVRIVCSGGTYVRALARDLGRSCGSAAHLRALRRTRSGPFDVADALSLEALKATGPQIQPALALLRDFPVQFVKAEEIVALEHGRQIGASAGGPRAALVDVHTGDLVAVAERSGDRWQPRVLMRPQRAHA
jgi:tRNA pseudouridine55 synthase